MTVEDFATWLTHNHWAIVVMAFCTVVGVPLSLWGLYLSWRGSSHPSPYYEMRGTNLVRGVKTQRPEIVIKYPGHAEPVENLTVSKVYFVNKGQGALRKSDAVKNHPLTLKAAEGALVLEESVLVSRPENQVEVKRSADRRQVVVTFEVLNHRDEFVLQVIHTGKSSDDLHLEGEFVGPGKPKRLQVKFARLTPLAWLAFGFLGGVLTSGYGFDYMTPQEISSMRITYLCGALFLIGSLTLRLLVLKAPPPIGSSRAWGVFRE